jgi:hypothetical protein
MFGDHAKQWDTDHEAAPGTYDGLRYGGTTTRKPDAYSQAVSLSDAETKRKAELAGKEAGATVAGSVPGDTAASKAAASVAPEERTAADHAAENLRHNADKAEEAWVRVGNTTPLKEIAEMPRNIEDIAEGGAVPGSANNPKKRLEATPGIRKLTTTSGAGKEKNIPIKTSDERAKKPEATPMKQPSESGGQADRGVPEGGEHVDNSATTVVSRTAPFTPGPHPKDGQDGVGGTVQDGELQRDANRKLRGETYRYKEGFGEETDRVHHGFMAQNLEENPITATAVRDDDGTGVKKVDNVDALRVTAAGVAQLQHDQDEMQNALAKLTARRRRA